MPRPLKGSPEAKLWGEKMRAAREKTTEEVAKATPNTEPNQDIEELKKQIAELKASLGNSTQQQQNNQPQVTAQGIVGTFTKFSLDPQNYPSPVDRLFEEPRLQLQGFNRNWWDISWDISRWAYETKDGRNVEEPKFHVELIRIVEDPETGEPSNKRYRLHDLTFFEDPATALVMAREMGMEVPQFAEKAFLDEMRYMRVRDWVLESFYPPKSQKKSDEKETVIGNRLVKVYEVNSTESESIPFNKLK